MQQAIPVNPEILRWARVEAGFSLGGAASRAGISAPRKEKDGRGRTAIDRLAGWESGSDAPSLPQLEQLAKAYRRPLATFFLPGPPEKMAGTEDYRTVAGGASKADSPEFSALRRKVAVLHRALRDLSIDAGSQELAFIGSLSDRTPVPNFVGDMRRALGVGTEDQMRAKDEDGLFRFLRSAAQGAGIYVLLMGDLGSHHTAVGVDEFRGMAIADGLAPVVVVNPNDSRAARLFTLMHELAHLWLGSRGISSFDALGTGTGYGSRERLCNRVAGEFLVPEANLRTALETTKESPAHAAAAIAKRFNVSEAALGRRLLDLGIIGGDEYGGLLAKCAARWKKLKDEKSGAGGAPKAEIMDRFRLGEKTMRTLISAAEAGRIGFQDAARLMGIPVSRFDKAMP
jgi:Zn-dependent peptidase ImmA (M78 family)/transcriptional regulator with XRE-family HTH domain